MSRADVEVQPGPESCRCFGIMVSCMFSWPSRTAWMVSMLSQQLEGKRPSSAGSSLSASIEENAFELSPKIEVRFQTDELL